MRQKAQLFRLRKLVSLRGVLFTTKQSFKIIVVLFMGFLISPLLVWAEPGPNDFQLTSPAFEANADIPKKYTCDGQDINPPLTFKNVPRDAKSLALTVSDPDALKGTWSHWIIYNIPPNTVEVLENTNPGTEGLSDFGKYAYGGPCPPGGKLHHYIFRLYALDTKGHIIAKTQLIGTYQRN